MLEFGQCTVQLCEDIICAVHRAGIDCLFTLWRLSITVVITSITLICLSFKIVWISLDVVLHYIFISVGNYIFYVTVSKNSLHYKCVWLHSCWAGVPPSCTAHSALRLRTAGTSACLPTCPTPQMGEYNSLILYFLWNSYLPSTILLLSYKKLFDLQCLA